MDNISVLIYSCDKYSDIWGPFFTLFFRYWECPYQVYLATESEQCLLPNIKTINTEGETWTERIRAAVEQIPTDYVIGMCEDFFFRRPVKQYIIDSCLTHIKRFQNIACFNFEKDYDGAYSSGLFSCFGKKPRGNNFQKSCQPTLWCKSILLELLDCKMDPWQWEESDTTGRYDFYIYTGHPEGVAFDYGYKHGSWFGIRKGKWVLEDVGPLFEKEGINIDLSQRGVYKE